MNHNQLAAASIHARDDLLAEVAEDGFANLTSEQMALAFHGWPEGHIDYFANAHDLVILATPHGYFQARRRLRGRFQVGALRITVD